jgi:hypothetical protein
MAAAALRLGPDTKSRAAKSSSKYFSGLYASLDLLDDGFHRVALFGRIHNEYRFDGLVGGRAVVAKGNRGISFVPRGAGKGTRLFFQVKLKKAASVRRDDVCKFQRVQVPPGNGRFAQKQLKRQGR